MGLQRIEFSKNGRQVVKIEMTCSMQRVVHIYRRVLLSRTTHGRLGERGSAATYAENLPNRNQRR